MRYIQQYGIQPNAVTVGRLFDRFYTVEVSRNPTAPGLSIVKVLIECMDGSIEASHNEGKLSITIGFLAT